MSPSDRTGRELLEIAALIEANHRFVARQRLRELLRQAAAEAPEVALEVYVFGAALAELLDDPALLAGTAAAALPHDPWRRDELDLPQAELFELLARCAPWLELATALVDALVRAHWPPSAREVALVELGLGTGRQTVSLLEALAAEPPERIVVVGIEPGRGALARGVERVRARAAELGLAVEVHPLCACAEELELEEWRYVRSLCGDAVVVASAVFALQHVPDAARAPLFERLHEGLAPAALVLCEPDMAHLGSGAGLAHRLAWCRAHYGVRFAELASAAPHDRELLQTCYYGREIAEVLRHGDRAAGAGAGAASWRDAVAAAGFVPALPEAPEARRQRHGDCVVAPSADGVLRIARGGQSLVALVTARGTAVGSQGAVVAAAVPPPYVTGTSLVMRLDAVPRPLDVHAYLAALCEVARADALVHDQERAFIERQARLLHFGPERLETLPDLATLLAERGQQASELDLRTRKAILRDLVFLARIDGDTAEAEREVLRAMAARLGLDEAWLARLERLAAVPDVLETTPSWFRETWFLGQR